MQVPGYNDLTELAVTDSHELYRARAVDSGREVVLKLCRGELPTLQVLAALSREHEILGKLTFSSGVINSLALVRFGDGNAAMVLPPHGRSLSTALAERDSAFKVSDVLEIAIQLVRTLAEVHDARLVHKDINPGNILWDDHRVQLIDFDIASELQREGQASIARERLEGTLPYLSPEQTGRLNRDLDYRSDFYSLGVTLFELLTGKRPFSGETALEWVHCHVSQLPPLASDVFGVVPVALARLVGKLLAKNPAERYQSSFGLLHDLEICRQQWEQSGTIELFGLGQRDQGRVFDVPQHLYGRDQDVGKLLEIFDLVSGGATELCMVSGYSGVGKSALVNQLRTVLIQENGFLVSGKFEQYQRNAVYSAVASAMNGLVQELLCESEERLLVWRQRLAEALGTNASLMIELVPDLELILGKQPPVPTLPATEAQNRFQIVLLNFVNVFASQKRPLVLFIDDVQWADSPTLDLIKRLVSSRDNGYLMIIGAYRSNEVEAGQPLHLLLNDLAKGSGFHDLPLHPLGQDAVDRMVADTVRASLEACRPLSRFIYDKTEGNPFFVRELLGYLYSEHHIYFDTPSGRWQWRMEGIETAGISHSVAGFVLDGLRRLDDDTQSIVQLAACIGNTFDLGTLVAISGRSLEDASTHIDVLLQRNLIAPTSEAYKYVRSVALAGGTSMADATYRFAHDRVQQAAYELIDGERKQTVHLSIGRRMQERSADLEADGLLIDTVGHLNRGRALITDADERLDLTNLNLRAGVSAHQSSAYADALDFLRVAQDLLPNDPWAQHYELACSIALEQQQCAYLTGRYKESERLAAQLYSVARTNLEKAEILSLRTRQYATMGRMKDSIECAIDGLALLGVTFLDNPTEADVHVEAEQVAANLGDRAIDALVEAPPIADANNILAIRLLMEIFPAAFLSGSGNLFPFLVLKSVNIALKHGNSADTAFAYAAYGMLLCGALNQPATGYQYGRLALALNERFDDIGLKSRVIYVYAMFIHHWSEHWSSMTPWFLRGIEAGYQSGDLLYLSYSAQDCVIWDPKLDLETAEREHAEYLRVVKDCEYQDSLDSGTLFLQLLRNYLGRTDDPASLSDDDFREDICVAGMAERRFMTGIANYHIYKAEACCLYGLVDQALEHVKAQDELVASAMSLPQLTRFYFIAYLTRCAALPSMSAQEQQQTRRHLNTALGQMRLWADNCEDNFRHLCLMMEAEAHRLDGRFEDALRAFDAAIEAADRSGFRRDLAMACELTARHLISGALPTAASGYLRRAHRQYLNWGAARKVALLEEEFPELVPRQPSQGTFTTQSGTFDYSDLDIESVLKASQSISGHVVLDRLWETTIQLLLENAGGEQGCLVVRHNNELSVRSQATSIGHEAPTQSFSTVADDLPLAIVNQVLRTHKALALDDACIDPRFQRDPYVQQKQPRSVLCVPIPRMGKMEGVIYMENNLVPGVFTKERIEVINLLTAQAVISTENAQLYEEQIQLIDAQRRFVPSQFLQSLEHLDIAGVNPGEYVGKTMSVMFADLRGFTGLAEKLPPASVIGVLNRYFVSMEPSITREGGFIGEFTGDEIMALFETGADRALAAGIGMCQALAQYNLGASQDDFPQLNMGIGVSTGQVMMGTVGTRDRVQCAVVGDTVNLASRIEQLTKLYGSKMLISEHTHRQLQQPERFTLRQVDRVAVQGKALPVDVYEVLDAEPEGPARSAKIETISVLDEFFTAYTVGDFESGQNILSNAAKAEDQAVILLRERCAKYLREPPNHWPGYERFTEK